MAALGQMLAGKLVALSEVVGCNIALAQSLISQGNVISSQNKEMSGEKGHNFPPRLLLMDVQSEGADHFRKHAFSFGESGGAVEVGACE